MTPTARVATAGDGWPARICSVASARFRILGTAAVASPIVSITLATKAGSPVRM